MKYSLKIIQSMFFMNLLFILIICGSKAALSQTPDVIDVASKEGFISVGDLYTNGAEFFMCVQRRSGDFSLWNPVTGEASSPIAGKCNLPTGFHYIINNITYPQLGSGKQIGNASFGGAIQIVRRTTGINNCGPNYTDYISITMNDGTREEYYVISRLKSKFTPKIPDECENALAPNASFAENFTDVNSMGSTDLGDGRTLLFSFDRSAQLVLLLISKLPSTVWSSNGNVFLVPRQILAPQLDNAGSDEEGRYRALLRVIGQK